MIKKLILCAAMLAMPVSAKAAIKIDTIVITNAIPDWLQVAELQAFQGIVNVAAAANGGSASITSIYGPDVGNPPRSLASNAIDGNTGGDYYSDYIAHSGSPNAGEALTVSLGGAKTINTLNVFGRTDCCSNRDLFNYSLLLGGKEVASGMLDARAGNFSTVSFGGVPEPTTWALMILGFGFAGAALRRRNGQVRKPRYAIV